MLNYSSIVSTLLQVLGKPLGLKRDLFFFFFLHLKNRELSNFSRREHENRELSNFPRRDMKIVNYQTFPGGNMKIVNYQTLHCFFFSPVSPTPPSSQVDQRKGVDLGTVAGMFVNPSVEWLKSSTDLNKRRSELTVEEVKVAKLTKLKLQLEIEKLKRVEEEH